MPTGAVAYCSGVKTGGSAGAVAVVAGGTAGPEAAGAAASPETNAPAETGVDPQA